MNSGNELSRRVEKITEHREFVSNIIHNTMLRMFFILMATIWKSSVSEARKVIRYAYYLKQTLNFSINFYLD